MKNITFLFAFFLSLLGGTQAWAQVFESFEGVTKVNPDTYTRTGELSNGWICINSSGEKNNIGIYNEDNGYYLWTHATTGSQSLAGISSSSASSFMVMPVVVTGDFTYYMACTSSSYSSQGFIEIYEVTDNGDGSYTIGSRLSSQSKYGSSSYNWLQKTLSLGDEGKMLAFKMWRSAIDDIRYTVYVDSPYKKPATITIGGIGSSSATVNWTASATDATLTGWNLEYKKTSDDTWTEFHGLGASTLSYTLSDLVPNTSYDVRISALYDSNESAWKTTDFKTMKIITPAVGFTDNFETDKGWEFINGTLTNNWTRGSATSNGGSYALYVSNDGGTTNAYTISSSTVVYAAKLFAFGAESYTISYDWLAKGESGWDYLRVALVPASVELTAGITLPNGLTKNTVPSGWKALDGGSELSESNAWNTKSVDFTIDEAGNYQVVFIWRNDGSGGTNPPAAIDNFKIIGSAPVLELGGDVVGTALDFGTMNGATTKTITITNSGKVAMENIALAETADVDNAFSCAALSKTTLAANESMDVEVTFTPTATKDYTGTFRISADGIDAVDVTLTATYSNSPATMAITVDESAVGSTVAFGSVGKQITKTFTVTNDGDQTLNITSIVSDNTTDFTVSPATLTVAGHSSETFTVTFVYPSESPVLDTEKAATITLTPSNAGLDPISFAVTGTRVDLWSEDFSGNALPTGWDAESYWTFADGVAHGAYNYSNNRTKALTTPNLIVTGNTDVLQFKAKSTSTYVTVMIKYSKDGGAFTELKSISLENNMADFETYEITGLEAGNYRFQFMNDDYDLDDFEGFKLVPVAAHAAEVKTLTIPAGNQYVEYTASVDVKVTGTNDEELTVKFFIGDDQYGSDVVKTVSANAIETFTVTFTPDAAVSGDAYFTIESADIAAFESDKTAVTIAAATVIDENAPNVFTSGTKPSVVLNYTKAAEKWGTITLPFRITVANLQTALGKSIKVYEYKSSTENSMTFGEASTLYAGYAYIIYSDEALDGARFFGVNFTATSATYDGSTVKFQATYEPIAAGGMVDKWGVTPNGEIMKGSAAATLKAMRGYLTASASAHLSIFIEDATTGITTVLSSKDFETENVYNLNGQKVNKAQKGLYIVNGRKVVKK